MKTNVETGLKTKSPFSTNLKWFRENENLTQCKLAELVGSNQKNITAYEAGRATPKPEMLIKMADVFGIKVDELIRDVNSKMSIREFNPIS
ncbi:helix-turn-helix domain-containing protein [Pedobacter agri]|uniref:Helix-turn-helix transcriptional regulator n=1 Tax=Pedobacter agri TaxID=454586 RepID=A0A9X3DBW9_9SPHI|nr:helix-turn-helix transcriptional regulator [Pedobacter agri]MCX3264797.1 helix-turn-helix transcriptional regulator [Pedobacter agri]